VGFHGIFLPVIHKSLLPLSIEAGFVSGIFPNF
jgi:hypothetical protein